MSACKILCLKHTEYSPIFLPIICISYGVLIMLGTFEILLSISLIISSFMFPFYYTKNVKVCTQVPLGHVSVLKMLHCFALKVYEVFCRCIDLSYGALH